MKRFSSQSDPHLAPMKDVLDQLFQEGEFAHMYKNRDMYYLWGQVCPEKYLDVTRMKSFYRGTLTIEVSSSAVLQEISNFYKPQIMESLKAIKGNTVKKLVFKLGKFTKGNPKEENP